MHRAVVSLPDGLEPRGALAPRRSLRRGGALQVGEGGTTLPLGASWDLAAGAALLAREEEIGAPVDEHGRFLAAGSEIVPGAAPLDELVRACAAARRCPASTPPPAYPGGARFAVALTHDIDTPWRWSAAACAARPPGQGALPRRLRRRPPRADRPGAGAAAPPARQRSQLVAPPLRRARARHGSARPASCSPPTGSARRRRPGAYARRRPRSSRSSTARARGRAARELHCLADGALIAGERPSWRACSEGPIAGNRHHYLRLRGTRHSRARPAGLRLRLTLGYAERPGPRAGFSFPFQPWDVAAGGRRASSSSRSS